jgi:hypothetical protein
MPKNASNRNRKRHPGALFPRVPRTDSTLMAVTLRVRAATGRGGPLIYDGM